MRAKLAAVLSCAEKIADAVKVAAPAIRKIVSIFGDDVVCIESDED